MKLKAERYIVPILWLVALHSFLVGCALAFSPASLLHFFGFANFGEKFFPVQGGVFHIVMSLAYALAAFRIERFEALVVFSILAKAIATIFLISYFFYFEQILVVLLSGIGDGLMAVVILWAFGKYKREIKNQSESI